MPTLAHTSAIDRSKSIFSLARRLRKAGSEIAHGERKSQRRRIWQNTILSRNDVDRAAALLFERFGESAIAGAMLHAHEAGLRGAFAEMANWRRIAESALQRFDA